MLSSRAASVGSFVLEKICKKCGEFKCPKVLLYDNESEFKTEVTKLLEKHNVVVRRATTKYKAHSRSFCRAIKEIALF